jgi:hypothetical protein
MALEEATTFGIMASSGIGENRVRVQEAFRR